MRKWMGVLTGILLFVGSGVAFAAEPAEAGGAFSNPYASFTWLVITAGFALAIAASIGAIAQSRALVSGCDGISRNPGSADAIRGLLILGLAFIESLVIYMLLVDLILLFITIGRIPLGE